MRRTTFDALMATGGLLVAIVLGVVGVLGLWAHGFVSGTVHDQLAAQKIYFPTTQEIAAQKNADITRYVTPYAGQQVLTGQQAEVFADHYIANHLEEIGQGQTYSEVSGKFLSMKPSDPGYAAVAQQRQSLFMGETLRGMLLNAYAFATMGQIALVAAISAFVGAAVMLVLSALGLRHLRRVAPEAELLPKLGGQASAVA